jgi:hypothetical protein
MIKTGNHKNCPYDPYGDGGFRFPGLLDNSGEIVHISFKGVKHGFIDVEGRGFAPLYI